MLNGNGKQELSKDDNIVALWRQLEGS
jgi:hypothetical protein